MRTLVDCGCKTKVHADGSGVEIYYCPVHEAAPDLLHALIAARSEIDHLEDYASANPQICDQIDAAIAKAGGES